MICSRYNSLLTARHDIGVTALLRMIVALLMVGQATDTCQLPRDVARLWNIKRPVTGLLILCTLLLFIFYIELCLPRLLGNFWVNSITVSDTLLAQKQYKCMFSFCWENNSNREQNIKKRKMYIIDIVSLRETSWRDPVSTSINDTTWVRLLLGSIMQKYK